MLYLLQSKLSQYLYSLKEILTHQLKHKLVLL